MAGQGLHRRIFRATVATDWASTRWISPLRIAVISTALVVVGLEVGGPPAAIPVCAGALFTGISDLRGDIDERLRGMVLTGLSISLAVFAGIAVSGDVVLHIAVSTLIAAICGYAGLAGPRAGLAGVLSLVLFVVFSGTPDPIGEALPLAAWTFFGALVMTASVILPLFTRRAGGLRSDMAIAYRAQGFALRGEMGGIAGVDAAAKVAATRAHIAGSGAKGTTRRWFDDLATQCERARVALIALEGDDYAVAPDDAEPVEQRFRAAASSLMIAIGSTLEIPARRRSLAGRASEFRSAAAECEASLGPLSAQAASAVTESLEGSLVLLRRPWPIGRRAELGLEVSVPTSGLMELLRHQDPNRLFTRHAIRLAIVILIATVIAQLLGENHGYWIPLTAAWITKPDIAGTVPRVAGRVAGTIVALIAVLVVALVAGEGQVVELAAIFFGGFIAAAFISSNYAICTFGVTLVLLGLLHVYDPVFQALMGQRLADTLIAGALVLAVSWAWPTRLTGELCHLLAAAAQALQDYARAVSEGDRDALPAARDSLRGARLRASGVVNAAAGEPRGHELHYLLAEQINSDLTRATAIAAGLDEYQRAGRRDALELASAQITPRALSGLGSLAERLEALHQGERLADGPEPDDGSATRFEGLVLDAQSCLNSALEPGRRSGDEVGV